MWVVLRAVPLSSSGWARSVASNTLLIGDSDPSPGKLALSPVETRTLADGLVSVSGFEEPMS